MIAPANKPIVLITGSSGLIGRSLAQRLLDRYEVIGLDVKGNPFAPPQMESIAVDLTKQKSVDAAMERVRHAHGEHIASVVHLAAYYDFSGEPSPLYDEVTVKGTERMFNALRDFTVQQFIFSSTLLVHAPTEPGRPINEDAPLEPKWDYPDSKVRTERLIRDKHGKIPYLILRVAGVYTDQCGSIPLAHQIQRIYERRLTSRVYPADPERGQPFIHLEDLLDALEKAIDRRAKLPWESVLLLGEPETFTYQQLQDTFGKLIHGEEEWKVAEVPAAVAKAGAWVQDKTPGADEPFIKPWMVDMAADHYELDIRRARENLDWSPAHRLIGTAPNMVQAMKKDPAAWYRRHKLGEPPQA